MKVSMSYEVFVVFLSKKYNSFGHFTKIRPAFKATDESFVVQKVG